MASTLVQIALLPAGCQPWNLNMVASCGPNFVYCATLAVYNYEYDNHFGEYKLTSINASHSKTITCISWNKDDSSLYATAGADEKLCVWNVKLRKCVGVREHVGFTPVCIGWIPGKEAANVLAYCGKHGSVQLWNVNDQTTAQVDYTNGFDHEITLFRWHHSDPDKFVFGHIDGSLSLHVSGIQLVDVKALVVINHFNMSSRMTSTITMSWVNSAPGMFLTGDHESGVLRLWSVSQSVPLENINLKATGFQCLCVLEAVTKDLNSVKSTLQVPKSQPFSQSRSASSRNNYSIPPAKVVCAFADGGVGLFNLQMKKWEFLREQGHIETIFDCKFKTSDPKLLATASFDGTIKVWSAVDLLPIATSTGNEGVIYSLSWAPGSQNCVACGTRRRGVFIWDADKCRFVKRFKEHGAYAVYCVAWNQRNPQKLASCSDDATCVVRKLDSRESQILKHPDSTFGCDWNLFAKDLLATGCKDGIVRVWNTSSADAEPCHSLDGHTAKVFHVRWHPLIQNLLCSGSDDRSVRVWDINNESCTMILQGHSAAVRGLSWNYEVPYILVSGSWDSTIRLWDVRDGRCIDTLLDHGADVYGLTSHPNNPFTMASSSRDSTLRVWSLFPMMQSLFLNVIAGLDGASIVATPDEVMRSSSPMKLAGSMSKQLMQQLGENRNADAVQLRWYSELFCTSRRVENLWDLACVHRGRKASSLSASYKSGIVHTKHLTKYKAAEAQESEHALSRKSSVSGQSRSRDLARVAQLYLKLGNLQRYCGVLIQLGQWERALALAPAVSLSYWSTLATRYADSLRNDGDEDASTFYIAAGSMREAVRYLSERNEYQDALLLAQASVEGSCPGQVSDEHPGSQAKTDGKLCTDLVSSCCDELAERAYDNADPYNAAAYYLAHDDVTSAIDCLVKSNKLSFALCLSRNLNSASASSTEAARMLARLCEGDDPILAVKLLQRFDSSCTNPGHTWTALHGVCARYKGEEGKPELHEAAGLPSPGKCDQRAIDDEKCGKIVDAMKYFLLGTSPQKGLEIAVKLLKKHIIDDADWTLDEIMNKLEAAFSVREDVLRQQSNTAFRTQLLAVSAYFGALYAYRRDYSTILKPMYEYAISLCTLSRRFDPDFPLVPADLQDEVRAISLVDMGGKEGDVMDRVGRRAGIEPLKCMLGNTIVNGSDLPTHSDPHVSTISKIKITGAAFVLEDERSVLSQNEAVMWAKCNQFSPTSSGARICPF